jgi:hypothetical protein
VLWQTVAPGADYEPLTRLKQQNLSATTLIPRSGRKDYTERSMPPYINIEEKLRSLRFGLGIFPAEQDSWALQFTRITRDLFVVAVG